MPVIQSYFCIDIRNYFLIQIDIYTVLNQTRQNYVLENLYRLQKSVLVFNSGAFTPEYERQTNYAIKREIY